MQISISKSYFSFEEDDTPDVLKPPADCKGFYMKTQGYRKVSGDYCMGGVELAPIRTECPNKTEDATSPNDQKPNIDLVAAERDVSI